MYNKCCVRGCNSRRKDTLLHKFPTDEKRLYKWIECLDDDDIRTSTNLRKYVCHKHFEKQFIKTNLRLWIKAYPTLFTPDEISSGVPDFAENINPEIDHDYKKKRHYDHTYFKDALPLAFTVSVKRPTNRAENTNIEVGDGDASGGDNDDHTRDDDDEKVPENVPEPLFSWEKTEVIEEDEMEVPTVPTGGPAQEQAEPSMYQDDDCVPVETDSGSKYINYRCNECNGNIFSGFRYTCVQCVDWDICGACEAREAHGAHYVLRVPSGRPYKEMQAVLETIRHQLMSENVFVQDVTESLKAEIKEEPVEEAPLAQEPAEPAAEPDPLACIHPDDELIFYDIGGEMEVSSSAGAPSSKRPRLEPARHPRDDTASIASDDYPIEILESDLEETPQDDTQIELRSSYIEVDDNGSKVLVPIDSIMGHEEILRQVNLNRLHCTKVVDDRTIMKSALQSNISRKLSTENFTVKRVLNPTSTATSHRFYKAPASQVTTRNVIPSTSTRGPTTSENKMSDNSKTPHRTTDVSSEGSVMFQGSKEVEKQVYLRIPADSNPADVIQALTSQVSVPIVPFKLMNQRPTRSRLLSEDIP